jgi:hypothetical protein
MTEEEFCLSDKAIFPREKSVTRFYPYIYLEDVKEFIKRLKKEIMNNPDILGKGMCEVIIDKLAGEKLI